MKNKAIILILEAMAGILLLLLETLFSTDFEDRWIRTTYGYWNAVACSKLHTPYGFDWTTGIFLSVSPIS